MSVAVSDETTAQNVFQHGLGVVRDNYSVAKITNDFGAGALVPSNQYDLVDNLYLNVDGSGTYIGTTDDREYEFVSGEASLFSWSVLLRRMAGGVNPGPMGNLCQAVIVVSRRGAGGADFRDEALNTSPIPEIRSVSCDNYNTIERTISIDPSANFDLVPNSGYIIDGESGIAYLIISRNDGGPGNRKVTILSEPPTTGSWPRDFWVVPGEFDGSYGRRSPAIRVFQAMLYLP